MCESDPEPVTICGLINDLEISLHVFPDISFLINVVVIDVPITWGMLLSRELVATLGDSFQMDGSNATIPHPEGGFVTLYKEPNAICQVETPKDPMNQIFYLDDRMGNLFSIDPTFKREPCQNPSGKWTLEFDGARSSFNSGAGVVLIASLRETFYFSYRLEYDCTNNVVEYEALFIGLNLDIDRKIKRIRVIGDFDLVVSQINLKFVAKNERIKKYRDLVKDTMKYFEEISIEAIP